MARTGIFSRVGGGARLRRRPARLAFEAGRDGVIAAAWGNRSAAIALHLGEQGEARVLNRKPIIERAFELAESGKFRIPSQVRAALVKEGYTQSDTYTLEGKATAAQLKARCMGAFVD